MRDASTPAALNRLAGYHEYTGNRFALPEWRLTQDHSAKKRNAQRVYLITPERDDLWWAVIGQGLLFEVRLMGDCGLCCSKSECLCVSGEYLFCDMSPATVLPQAVQILI